MIDLFEVNLMNLKLSETMTFITNDLLKFLLETT